MQKSLLVLALLSFVAVTRPPAAASDADGRILHTRSRVQSPDKKGPDSIVFKRVEWDPKKTAILVSDTNDPDWGKAAAEMAPRLSELLGAARRRGMLVVHAAAGRMELKITPDDIVSDSAVEIGKRFAQRGIGNVILAGTHWNASDIHRLLPLGMNVVLVRDLTGASYKSHVRGADLIVRDFEKSLCPSITSSDLLGGPAFRFQEDKRPHVAMIIAENEYSADKVLPAFGEWLEDHCGCYCTIAQGPGEAEIFGLDELKTADVAVVFVRRRPLPKEQLDLIRAYLDAGKPLVAMRTASHAFAAPLRAKAPPGTVEWKEFDHDVLGGNYHDHGKLPTEVRIAPGAAGDAILNGVEPAPWASEGTLYFTSPIDPTAKLLLIGSSEGKTEPAAWTRTYKGSRVFYTSLGHPADFATPQFRALLRNAIFWAMNRPLPDASTK